MEEKKIQIKAKDETLQGKYANVLQVQHSKEEFVLDFLTMFPPVANLSSRIITSPGHYKRMIMAMQENLKKYEDSFGKIEFSSELNNDIGFSSK